MAAESVVVVADSGPLIALAGAGCLGLLHSLFQRVVVPRAVLAEILAPPSGRPGAAAILAADWIEIADPTGAPDPLLSASLDSGEAAVIALARTISGAVVLLDERRGRQIASTAYRLQVVGTVGVLVRAKRAGLLPAVGPVLDAILRNGYFLSERLVQQALAAARE